MTEESDYESESEDQQLLPNSSMVSSPKESSPSNKVRMRGKPSINTRYATFSNTRPLSMMNQSTLNTPGNSNSQFISSPASSSWYSKSQLPYDTDDDAENHGKRHRYDDWTTIDWMHDVIKQRRRHRLIQHQSFLLRLFDSAQAWIVLFLVGAGAGALARIPDFINPLLHGFRDGYCIPLHTSKNNCKQWQSWNSIYGDLIGFIIYLLASLLMALISTAIVSIGPSHKFRDRPNIVQNQREFLSTRTLYHAAGSGIPEVKTILGGFVIKKFLGLKTLVVKVISLVFGISSGLCIGVQGPLVHISCCLGNVLTRIFSKYQYNEAKRRY
jgi:chloride channel 3/4/5